MDQDVLCARIRSMKGTFPTAQCTCHLHHPQLHVMPPVTCVSILGSWSGFGRVLLLDASGLPFVWERPSGRLSVVCVLLFWVLLLRLLGWWHPLRRWDPPFARPSLLPRALSSLLVIRTPPGLFGQVIRQRRRRRRKKKHSPNRVL